MANKGKRLEAERRERRIRKLAKLARKIDHIGEPDRLEQLLDGTDDGWEEIRQKVIALAGARGEWAGYPLPDEDHRLVIEPRHPLYESLNGFRVQQDREPGLVIDQGIQVINAWVDHNRGRNVFIYRENGRIHGAVIPKYTSTHRAGLLLGTLGASRAWSVRAEFTAMARLKTLVTKAAFRYYLLTGTFIESSKRSGVFYLFRKCRPTIAFKGTIHGDNTKLLAALCLHPIGYYEGTFAGSMVPTDDVIAHLLMMRGDERKFWSKCNQHDCRDGAAGV